jgi:DNA-binding SARP family transcriptional activator
LRQTIHRLRQSIPELVCDGQDPAPLLLTDRQTIQINPDVTYSLDVATFKNLIDPVQKHAHESVTACEACKARLKQAVALYQGDFLADFYLPDSNPFEEWSLGKREALRRQVLDAFDTLSQAALNRADCLEAQQTARRRLEFWSSGIHSSIRQ